MPASQLRRDTTRSRTVATWFVRFRAQRASRVLERQLTVTLVLLSMVGLPVLGLWLGGKLSWNHDPLTSQRFRLVETSALFARPKDTALQFHHALNTLEFGEARLLATAHAEALVVARERECEVTQCRESQPTQVDALVTRATVLQQGATSAVVRAETFEGLKQIDDVEYEVTRQEGRWLVSQRRAE